MTEYAIVLSVPVKLTIEAKDAEEAVEHALEQINEMAEKVTGYEIWALECCRVDV